MKKLLILLLLSTSFSTFALELDFWSTDSFCFKQPDVQLRNSIYYLPNQSKGVTSESLCIYTNGQYHSKSNLVNGKFDGKYTQWHANGYLNWDFNYKDGEMDGEIKSWYVDGCKEWEYTVKDGVEVGRGILWHYGCSPDEDPQIKVEKMDGVMCFKDQSFMDKC